MLDTRRALFNVVYCHDSPDLRHGRRPAHGLLRVRSDSRIPVLPSLTSPKGKTKGATGDDPSPVKLPALPPDVRGSVKRSRSDGDLKRQNASTKARAYVLDLVKPSKNTSPEGRVRGEKQDATLQTRPHGGRNNPLEDDASSAPKVSPAGSPQQPDNGTKLGRNANEDKRVWGQLHKSVPTSHPDDPLSPEVLGSEGRCKYKRRKFRERENQQLDDDHAKLVTMASPVMEHMTTSMPSLVSAKICAKHISNLEAERRQGGPQQTERGVQSIVRARSCDKKVTILAPERSHQRQQSAEEDTETDETELAAIAEEEEHEDRGNERKTQNSADEQLQHGGQKPRKKLCLSTIASRDLNFFDELYGFSRISDRLDRLPHADLESSSIAELTRDQLEDVIRAFECFQGAQHALVSREDLQEAVRYLGILVPDSVTDTVRRVIKPEKDSQTRQLDRDEFVLFVAECVRMDMEKSKRAFRAHTEKGSELVNAVATSTMFASLGLLSSASAVSRAMEAFELDKKCHMSFDDFLRVRFVYMHIQAFTTEHVGKLWKHYHSCRVDLSGERNLKKEPFILGDFITAVVGFFGPHIEKFASEQYTCLRRYNKGDVGYNANVPFADFLIFCRRVCEREQAYQRTLFKSKANAEGDLIEVARLNEVLRLFGYKLRRPVLEELLREVTSDGNSHIHFYEFCSLIALLKGRDGFLAQELDEFQAIFDKFDEEGSGSLSVGHLENLMRELGFRVSTNRLQEMLLEVDDDNSGSLDYQEFVRLLQLHFKAEDDRLSDIFNQLAILGKLGSSNIWSAVEMAVGEDIDDDMQEQALSVEPKKVFDYQDFRVLAERVRRMLLDVQQRQAGFTNDEMVTLRELFRHYDLDGSGGIDAAEAQSFLHDFGISCESKEDQKRLVGLIDSARASASNAAVDSDDSPKAGCQKKKTDLTFMEIVHLVRLLKNEQMNSGEQQKQRFVNELGFSKEEGVEFLRIFMMWARRGSFAMGKNVKTLKMSTDSEESTVLLSHDKFVQLVLSLEVQIYPQEKDMLLQKLQSVGNGEGLSFEGFLVMMRWLLDQDFCGIKHATANTARASSEGSCGRAPTTE